MASRFRPKKRSPSPFRRLRADARPLRADFYAIAFTRAYDTLREGEQAVGGDAPSTTRREIAPEQSVYVER